MKTFNNELAASDSSKQCIEIIDRLAGQAGNVSGRGLDEAIAWSLEHFEKHSHDCSLVERLFERMSQTLMELQAKQVKYFAYNYFGISLKFDKKTNAMSEPAFVDKPQRAQHNSDDRKDIIRQIKDETIGTAKLYKELNKKTKAEKSTEQKYNEYKEAIEKKLKSIHELKLAASTDKELTAKICRSLESMIDDVDTLFNEFNQIRASMASAVLASNDNESQAA